MIEGGKTMKFALAGNPNSGKTTLFNAITGKAEYVGNWAGVTVEKKEANLKRRYGVNRGEVRIVDLPGAYSLSPFTGEEAITRDFVLGENLDVIINIVDGANFSRSLFFTTQLLELGIPVVVALNKSDILSKRGDTVDLDNLSKTLNCKVISISAANGEGVEALMREAVSIGKEKKEQITPKIMHRSSDMHRQRYVDSIIKKCLVKKRDAAQITLSDQVDRIVAHKWFGLPIFFLIMWAVFTFSIEGLGGFLSGYLNDVLFGQIVPNTLNNFFEGIGLSSLLQALIVDGAIGGVGAVVGFLPLIMVLFFCLALLEDCGYMARVAVIMDGYFKKIGLSGKSVIPMIVGSGCSVPGIMTARTIEDVNERRMTIMLTPFVPCGAKLPIIALFTAVFFPKLSWVGPSIYILAIAMIIIGGILLKKIFGPVGSSQFIIELPEYKIPSLKQAVIQMFDQAKGFIYKATTIILVCNTFVWFAQAYSWGFQPVEDQSTSILASVGNFISPILIPIGLAGWQLAAAAITGAIAKENVVATLAVVLAVTSEDTLHLPGGILTEFFTPVTGIAFLAFNLFIPPCFAAIGAMNSELGSKKWLFRAIAFQFSMGYIVAMLIAQVGSLLVYRTPAPGFIPAIIIIIFVAGYLGFIIRRANLRRVELGVED